MTRTPWFPGTVKPVRVGLYEARFLGSGVIYVDWWNGEQWCNAQTHKPWPEGSVGEDQWRNGEWRGLTEEAK